MNKKEAIEILELDGKININNIKSSYRKLARKYHPDRNNIDTDKMILVNAAYEFLKPLYDDDDEKNIIDVNKFNKLLYLSDKFTYNGVCKLYGHLINECGKDYNINPDELIDEYREDFIEDVLIDYKMTLEELCENTLVLFIENSNRIVYRKF